MAETSRAEQFEDLPSKEQIIWFLEINPNAIIKGSEKEKSDERGLYYLEFKVEAEEEGETLEYVYAREGKFDSHQSAGTSIYKTHYDQKGEFITYPEHIATYNSQTQSWEEV